MLAAKSLEKGKAKPRAATVRRKGTNEPRWLCLKATLNRRYDRLNEAHGHHKRPSAMPNPQHRRLHAHLGLHLGGPLLNAARGHVVCVG